MKQERVDPGWAWTKKLNIAAGVKIGDTVYLSGTVAFDSDGNVVVAGSVYEQSKQVFINIEEALASAGASMADVIKITTFLTDISGYGEFRPKDAGNSSASKRTNRRVEILLLDR